MREPSEPLSITPRDYELLVKGILDKAAEQLVDYRSEHLALLGGADGEYVIDVVATFSALGAKFVVLVECKHQARKVERQEVQVLNSKLQSLAAQKGMLFSVSGFQSGALDYAAAHGIALVEVAAGVSNWHTRSSGPSSPPPSWIATPDYIGWLCSGNTRSLLSEKHGEYTRKFLGLGEN
ncbi:MAG: restriction endonuclease [Betaproteobacteria bacterium]|jgi:restriction system protein|nr:MAG: restriction endonuclease [Betaproteobacteria bacterium]